MEIQINTGEKSDIWEIDALLKKNGLNPQQVIESIEFDSKDNLLVNLHGEQAEKAAELLKANQGNWNSYLA